MKPVEKTQLNMITKLKAIARVMVRKQLNIGNGYDIHMSDDVVMQRTTNESATATYITTLKGRTCDHRHIEFVAEYQNTDDELQFTLKYTMVKSSIVSITPVTEMIDLKAYIDWCDSVAIDKIIKKDESKNEIINKRIVPIITRRIQKTHPNYPIQHITKKIEEIIQSNPRQNGIGVEEYVDSVTYQVKDALLLIINICIQSVHDYCAKPNDTNLCNVVNSLTTLSEYNHDQYNLYNQTVNIVKYITDLNRDKNSLHYINLLKPLRFSSFNNCLINDLNAHIVIESKQPPSTSYLRVDLQQRVNTYIEIKFNAEYLLNDDTGILKVATELFEMLNNLQRLNREKNPIELIYEMMNLSKPN